MASATFEDETRIRPPVGGSLVYLVLNLPVGIVGFVVLLTLTITGISTAIIWVGVPIAALAILLARGAAQVERARIYALLGTYIPEPDRRLLTGSQKDRWISRLKDPSTWRDYTYFFLLFPLGIIQFVLTVTLWSVSLGLIGLPIYYRFLPEGAWHFPGYYPEHLRWITVDSIVAGLPWVAAGVLLLVGTALFTRSLANAHIRFARLMLGSQRDHQQELPVNPAAFSA